jgi:hypothetical protein
MGSRKIVTHAFFLALSLAACEAGTATRKPLELPNGVPPATTSRPPNRSTLDLRELAREGRSVAGNCSRSESLSELDLDRQWLVAASAQQCLSCMQIGYLVRSIERHAHPMKDEVAVVAPAVDSGLVCDFLSRERSSARVILVSSEHMGGSQFFQSDQLTVQAPSAGSSLPRVIQHRSVTQLLEALLQKP